MAPAYTGHRGDTGGGKSPPPMVPSMQHYGAMVLFEWYASAHRVMQEGGEAKVTVPE